MQSARSCRVVSTVVVFVGDIIYPVLKRLESRILGDFRNLPL